MTNFWKHCIHPDDGKRVYSKWNDDCREKVLNEIGINNDEHKKKVYLCMDKSFNLSPEQWHSGDHKSFDEQSNK